MPDFSHLRDLHVTAESEAEYKYLHPRTDEVIASIWFAPMTDDNPAYTSERMRIAVERAEKAKDETRADLKKRILSPEAIEEDRELDRVLMARCCAKRWGTFPKDTAGNVVTDFDEAAVYQFLSELPNYLLDPSRGFVGNVLNFVVRPPLAPGAGETLGN